MLTARKETNILLISVFILTLLFSQAIAKSGRSKSKRARRQSPESKQASTSPRQNRPVAAKPSRPAPAIQNRPVKINRPQRITRPKVSVSRKPAVISRNKMKTQTHSPVTIAKPHKFNRSAPAVRNRPAKMKRPQKVAAPKMSVSSKPVVINRQKIKTQTHPPATIVKSQRFNKSASQAVSRKNFTNKPVIRRKNTPASAPKESISHRDNRGIQKVKASPRTVPKNRSVKVVRPSKIKVDKIHSGSQRKTVTTHDQTISYVPSSKPRKTKTITRSNAIKREVNNNVNINERKIVKQKFDRIKPKISETSRSNVVVQRPRKRQIVREKNTRIAKTIVKSKIVRPRAVKTNHSRPRKRNVSQIVNTTQNVYINDGGATRYIRGDRHRHRRGGRHGPHRRRIYSRIIWPRYRYPLYYRYGSSFRFRYFRPYHHRKYVFVSLGGWWPSYYRYTRYYWYGWHPYRWYGSYPVAYRYGGNSYNYYTYNYYDTEAASSTYSGSELQSVDETTFADVREKLADQEEEPDAATLADQYFEEGVAAFEEEDYHTAIEKFGLAMELEPNDVILPFAYIQALFADERYVDAADNLRQALSNLPPDTQGLFFPRGLYTEDEILTEQMERLETKADIYTFDPDIQLLFGYQLLGTEKYEQARQVLQKTEKNAVNYDSANLLLNLLEKIEEQ